MKPSITATLLPHLLVQITLVLLASGGAILYSFTEVPGMVLIAVFVLFQVGTYAAIRIGSSVVQERQARWLQALQQLVSSLFIVLLLTILAVILWSLFEYSIWHMSGNGGSSYTFYLEHVVVSLVPQVVNVLLLGEALRVAFGWFRSRFGNGRRLTTSD
ncbi:hypothetical protein [Pontibacter rugosus]|uniref:Uncharacterized protein n=1 Tax=Pontibacter rugosus TaxID=1745966 RepID=A0ABW3SMV4_9BACT